MAHRSLYRPVPPLLSRFSFAAFTAFTGYIFRLTLDPPQLIYDTRSSGTGPKKTVKDTVSTRQTWFILRIVRNGCFLLTFLQAAMIALPDWPVAPRPPDTYPLNSTLLTWNYISVTMLSTLLASSVLRLFSFQSLGTDFTFQLRAPRALNTSGLYSYVQHPSYTGGVVACLAYMWWFMRCDGIMGTLFPETVLESQHRIWNWVAPGIASLLMVAAIGLRVREEEELLNREFGAEWRNWHARTARFVPWLF